MSYSILEALQELRKPTKRLKESVQKYSKYTPAQFKEIMQRDFEEEPNS